MAEMRHCPVCNGKRFIDGFRRSNPSLLCPVCKGDGCVPALTDHETIAFGKQFELLAKKESPNG